MSFTEEDEAALINIIKTYPDLYDMQSPNYRNIRHKERTWDRIARDLDKPKEECKRKWKFIRDGYQRYKKNHYCDVESSPSLAKVKRHNQLEFLDKVFRPRKSRRLSRSSQISGNTEYVEDPICIVKEEPGTVPLKFEIDANRAFSDDDDEWKTEENVVTDEPDFDHRHVKRNQVQRESTSTGATEKKDDIEYFCLHIAEVLRKLPPVDKAKAKKHLNEVLSDYEILAAQCAVQCVEPPTPSNYK